MGNSKLLLNDKKRLYRKLEKLLNVAQSDKAQLNLAMNKIKEYLKIQLLLMDKNLDKLLTASKLKNWLACNYTIINEINKTIKYCC